jgi:SAM-dependent methyltransferase
VLHTDRERAESFGQDPASYDRLRPSYPSELVDELLADAPRDVLDVGCGTGIAGSLLAARGCRVLGVVLDQRMAVLARAKGLDVEISAFETWDPRGRSFDLLTCGQAWHWIDPALGLQRAAAALREHGRIALF